MLTPATRRKTRGLAARYVLGGVVVVVVGGLGAVASFASHATLTVQLALCRPALHPLAEPYVYAASLLAMTLLFWLAARLIRLDREQWGFVAWLLGLSIVGGLYFGWVSLFTMSFYGMGLPETSDADIWMHGLLFFAALAGPSIATFVASIVLVAAPRRTVLAPPLTFLAVAAAPALLLGIFAGTSCGG